MTVDFDEEGNYVGKSIYDGVEASFSGNKQGDIDYTSGDYYYYIDVNDDGSYYGEDSYGTKYTKDAEGNTRTEYSDGGYSYYKADGDNGYHSADDSYFYDYDYNADGTFTYKDSYGNTISG